MLYRDIKFNNGSLQDRMGATPISNTATFSQKEKGLALEGTTGKSVEYDRQLLPPSGAFSVVVWAKSISLGTPAIAANGNMGVPSITMDGTAGPLIYLANNNYRYFVWTNDKEWHCFVFTINGSAQADITSSQCFVDGISRVAGTTVNSTAQDARTNARFVGGGNNTRAFISRLKVYDTVLTQQEINAEYAEFLAAQPINKPKRGFIQNKATDLSPLVGSGAGQGLVAAYNMVKNGTTLVDISGNGKTATTSSGGFVFNTKGLISPKGGHFATPSMSMEGDFSISFRSKTLTTAEISNILQQGGSATSNVWVYYRTSGEMSLDQNSGGSATFIISNKVGQENTFTFTFESSTHTTTLYQNGVSVGTSLGYNPSGSRTAAMNIGAYPGDTTYTLKNELIDLRLHNRILSLSEIKAYHNSFVQPTLVEDFSDAGADEITKSDAPREWERVSGTWKVGENVISNTQLTVGAPNFSTNVGWNLSGATISGGLYTGTTSGLNYCTSNVTLVAGKRYKIEVNILTSSNNAKVYVGGKNTSVLPVGFSTVYVVMDTVSNQLVGFNDLVGTSNYLSITEAPQLDTMVNGTKYLECVTAGVIAIPSQTAYGTWEFDLYKGSGTTVLNIGFIGQDKANYPTQYGGYRFIFESAEDIYLDKINGASAPTIMHTAASYITFSTWYRCKVTRTVAGVYTIFIKGGAFTPTAGYDGWTLISSSASGSNPATDNTYTTSNYFTVDLDATDRFANLLIKDGIKG